MMRPVGIDAVRAEIARACRDAGREADSVTLVAASKTFDADAIEPVVAAGALEAVHALEHERNDGEEGEHDQSGADAEDRLLTA